MAKNTKTEKPKREIKIRPIEELKEMSVKSMSGHEAKEMVTHLREQLLLAENKIEEYKSNIEATREQNQQTIKRAEAMEMFYRDRLAYVDNTVKNLRDSIDIATKGLVNNGQN